MMTQEEAITSYEKLYAYIVGDDDTIELDYGEFMELNHYIRIALRPVSREKVEKVWRGNWKKDSSVQVLAPGGQKYHFRCSKCGYITRLHDLNFCSECGAPMTDEAVEMVVRRLEELHENP